MSADLWSVLQAGRPDGTPVYRRPSPLTGSSVQLPWMSLDAADDPAALSELQRVAAWTMAVCGISRFEPNDLLGPHHVTPTIRGVRVVRVEVRDASGWTGTYDPSEHTVVGAGDPPALLRAERIRLLVGLDRVPPGYGEIRPVVGLMEAGMHRATAELVSAVLLPDWQIRRVDPPSFDTSPPDTDLADTDWAMLEISRHPATLAASGGADDRSGPRPTVGVFDNVPLSRLLRARSSGGGPWGVAPEPGDPTRRRAAEDLVARATRIMPAGIRAVPLSPAELAQNFTYGPSIVNVAAADAAVVWVARRGSFSAAAAVLDVGGAFMAVALTAAAEGFVARPARSIDPVAIHRALHLDPEDVVVATALVSRNSYQELSLQLA